MVDPSSAEGHPVAFAFGHCKYGGRPSAHVSMRTCVFFLVGVSPGQEPPEPGRSTLMPSRNCHAVVHFLAPPVSCLLPQFPLLTDRVRAGLTYLVPGLLSGGRRVWGPRDARAEAGGQESLGSGSGWGHPCLGVPEQRPLEAVGGGRWQAEYPWSPLTSSL